VESHPEIISAIRQFNSYICSETLACRLQMVDRLSDEDREMVELTDQCTVHVKVSRVQ